LARSPRARLRLRRPRACEPWRDWIESKLAIGRNAKAIWQELVDEHGFAGDYQSVKRFVRKLHGSPAREACAIIETPAGEEAQADYGEGPMVRDPNTGKYRRARLFVLTLGYSRKSVRLLTFQSSTRIWAELHEQAFRRIGGSTRIVVLDNLREGVLKPDIYDPALNPLYRDLLAHYGAVGLPCRVGHPDCKACVSYCTLSGACNVENWLRGTAASLALANRTLVQRFIKTAPGSVVAVLFEPSFSCPKIDCSGRHIVPDAHLFGSKQPLGSQPAIAAHQVESLSDMRNLLLQAERFTLPSLPSSSI
jgi:transposase